MNNFSISSNSFGKTPAFKARLFDSEGNQIKAFELKDQLDGKDLMATRGNGNTDIFIKGFISEEDGYVGYKNSVKVKVENPLFGAQEFIQKLHHATNSPIKGDLTGEMYHFDLLTGFKTNDCKGLENKALRNRLIDEIQKKITRTQYHDLNPVKILENIFEEEKPSTLGFNHERIRDFQKVAENLLDELIRESISKIKK